MTAQAQQEPQGLAQKVLALVEQCEGLKVTLSGNRDDIKTFWQNMNTIKELCQEELKKP